MQTIERYGLIRFCHVDYCDFYEYYHNDLNKMREWLRTYKMVDGKGENVIAYDGIVSIFPHSY